MNKEQLLSLVASGRLKPDQASKLLDEFHESFREWVKNSSLGTVEEQEAIHRRLGTVDAGEDIDVGVWNALDQLHTVAQRNSLYAQFPSSGSKQELRKYVLALITGGSPDRPRFAEPVYTSAFNLLYRRYRAERSRVDSIDWTEDQVLNWVPPIIQHEPPARAKQHAAATRERDYAEQPTCATTATPARSPTKQDAVAAATQTQKASNPAGWIIGVIAAIAVVYGIAWFATQGQRAADQQRREAAEERLVDWYISLPPEKRDRVEDDYRRYKKDPWGALER